MAEIQDVLVFVDGRPQAAPTIEFAANLAQEHDAHLTGTFMWPAIVAESAAAYARGSAIQELLAAHDAEVALLESDRRKLFERAASRGGLRTEWRSTRPLLAEDMVVHARYADLVLVARSDSAAHDVVPLDLPQSLVLASGRPVILLPSAPPLSVGRRILVGWNASREATRAVADALPLLARAEAVRLLVVDAEHQPTGHGQEPGADIARHLLRHRVQVEVHRASSAGQDVGRLILSEAGVFGADLVVMGAYGHSRFTEFVFGGATRTALHEAALPVLMSR